VFQILKIRIRDINTHIVCSLCAGYYIDATTITECLHTCALLSIASFEICGKNDPTFGLVIFLKESVEI